MKVSACLQAWQWYKVCIKQKLATKILMKLPQLYFLFRSFSSLSIWSKLSLSRKSKLLFETFSFVFPSVLALHLNTIKWEMWQKSYLKLSRWEIDYIFLSLSILSADFFINKRLIPWNKCENVIRYNFCVSLVRPYCFNPRINDKESYTISSEA